LNEAANGGIMCPGAYRATGGSSAGVLVFGQGEVGNNSLVRVFARLKHGYCFRDANY
jgi:hypothetical protein